MEMVVQLEIVAAANASTGQQCAMITLHVNVLNAIWVLHAKHVKEILTVRCTWTN